MYFRICASFQSVKKLESANRISAYRKKFRSANFKSANCHIFADLQFAEHVATLPPLLDIRTKPFLEKLPV
jgi:hypothetical protein